MSRPVSAREEDYLKAIFKLSHGQNTPVSPGALVERLGVSSAAVTRMTQHLATAKLLHRTAYQGVYLTEEGRQHALRVLRFHRLGEVFMVEQLGYDWSEVDEVADEWEHAMTESFAVRLEQLLGFPVACPHGDTIPTADLQMRAVRERPLTTLLVGQEALINRVVGDAAMLHYLKEHDLLPGKPITLLERQLTGGLLTVQRGPMHVLCSTLVAGAIFVRPALHGEEGAGESDSPSAC